MLYQKMGIGFTRKFATAKLSFFCEAIGSWHCNTKETGQSVKCEVLYDKICAIYLSHIK
jgi:hypothetical protein